MDTHAAVGIAITSMGPVHRRHVYLALVQEPVLVLVVSRQLVEIDVVLTSVTMMPANGPRKTVYPLMKVKKP